MILTIGSPDRGTALTKELAERMDKPCLGIDLDEAPDAEVVRRWASQHRLRVLNVAAPRESSRPGIYERAREFLRELL